MNTYLKGAGKKIGVSVDDPHWVQLNSFKDTMGFEDELQAFINNRGTPSIVVILSPFEKLYKRYKSICYANNVVSQVIVKNTYKKMNAYDDKGVKNAQAIAFNVLKQITSKLGGDLFYIKFEKDISLAKTMLIGIDVTHAGPQSIVGFCASINK